MNVVAAILAVLGLAGFNWVNQSSGSFTVDAGPTPPTPAPYTGNCSSPEEIAGLPESSWCQDPSSELDAIKEPIQPYGRNFRYVMDAWNGATFDTNGNRLILPAGGGHDDTANNGVFAYDMDTFNWEVLTPSSVQADIPFNDPGETLRHEVYLDGQPASTHTYFGITFDEARNVIYRLGGAQWQSGGSGWSLWEYDLTSYTWALLFSIDSFSYNTSVYIPEYDSIYYMKSSLPLRRVDISSPSVVNTGSNAAGQNYYTPLIWDVDEQILVQLGNGIARHFTFSSATSSSFTDVTTTGCAEVVAQPSIGGAYHPPSGNIYYYVPDVAETRVFSYDSQTLTCTEHAAAPGNLVTPEPNPIISSHATDTRGIFGRWQWAPHPWDETKGVFVGVSCTTCNVFFWRPPS